MESQPGTVRCFGTQASRQEQRTPKRNPTLLGGDKNHGKITITAGHKYPKYIKPRGLAGKISGQPTPKSRAIGKPLPWPVPLLFYHPYVFLAAQRLQSSAVCFLRWVSFHFPCLPGTACSCKLVFKAVTISSSPSREYPVHKCSGLQLPSCAAFRLCLQGSVCFDGAGFGDGPVQVRPLLPLGCTRCPCTEGHKGTAGLLVSLLSQTLG